MAQEEVIKVVNVEPGIVRTEVHTRMGVSMATASEQIRVLIRKKELIQVKSGRICKLYRRKTNQSGAA